MTGASASTVSQRLCNLLLSFPEAAVAGVQWQALARKYEERHAQRLDLQALGHSSALAAASTLLWDVLRIADSEDTDNPIVALEDHVALSAQPGLLGCWPSLYKALCDVALEHGSPEPALGAGVEGVAVRGLLMSQLKPLLEKQWHTSFEEKGLGYLTAEGNFVKLKKMKHLVQAVIGWRSQRLAWRLEGSRAPTEIDEALAPSLELAPSSRHNDLVLCCSVGGRAAKQEVASTPAVKSQVGLFEAPCKAPRGPVADAEAAKEAMEQELALLRAENAALRGRNLQLEAAVPVPVPVSLGMVKPQLQQPQPQPRSTLDEVLQLQQDVFDDPFEPPPEARSWKGWGAISSPGPSSSTSCCGSRDLAWESNSSAYGGGSDFGEYVETPRSSRVSSMDFAPSKAPSGAMTPRETSVNVGEAHAAFLPVSMWWTLVPNTARGALEIPCGIVQSMRAHFEPGAGAQ